MTKITSNIDEMIHRYEISLPMNVEDVVATLREQERHAMADLIEGLTDQIAELKTKLDKVVKNRTPRKKLR